VGEREEDGGPEDGDPEGGPRQGRIGGPALGHQAPLRIDVPVLEVVRANRAMVAGLLIFGALMLSVHVASGRNPGTKLPPSAENLIVPASEENSTIENFLPPSLSFPPLPPLPKPENFSYLTPVDLSFTPVEFPAFPDLDNIPVLVPPEEW
jgi:hypothetical protein